MNRFTCILFDLDGNLIDTLGLWLISYKKSFAARKIDIEDEEIVDKVFGKWQGPVALGVKDIDKYNDEVVENVSQGLNDVQLHAGVFSTLKKLKDLGKKIGLLTSSKRQIVYPLLRKLRIIDFFDSVLTKDDVINTKPDPEILYKGMDKLDCKPVNSIIVGDSEHDIRAGKNAGIRTVLFYPRPNHQFYKLSDLKKEKPDFVIENFEDLLGIVNAS